MLTALPASSSSSVLFLCDEVHPVLYLKDSSNNCLRRSPKNKDECDNVLKYLDMYHFYKNYRVLAIPQLFNASFSDVRNFKIKFVYSINYIPLIL